jgi:hypothetical protein
MKREELREGETDLTKVDVTFSAFPELAHVLALEV